MTMPRITVSFTQDEVANILAKHLLSTMNAEILSVSSKVDNGKLISTEVEIAVKSMKVSGPMTR